MNKYISVQSPLIKSSYLDEYFIYNEMLPSVDLKDTVCCYFHIYSQKYFNSPFLINLLPDGCVTVFIDLNNKYNIIVLGPVGKPMHYPLHGNVNLFAIRFVPGKFSTLLNVSANTITNKTLPLKEIFKDIDLYYESYSVQYTIDCLKNYIDEELTKFLLHNSDLLINKNITNSIDYIYENNGHVLISDLADITSCSLKTLTRKYNYIIGFNPKLFCRIVRFQHVLNTMNTDKNINMTDLALLNGYYDQSHFIKEFKEFYGSTPSEIVI